MPGMFDNLLKRYDDREFVIRLKARFIAYCYITVFLVILISIIYAGYAHLNNPLYGYSLNFKTLSVLTGGLILSMLGLVVLGRGHFALAANFLLICGFTTVWTTIFVDQTHVVSRLDSIVLVIGLLAMMPIVILKRPVGMILYAGTNILLLYGFMFMFRDELNLPYASFISYLADNTVTILAVTVISYQVYSINRRALKKAEHDILVRKRAEELIRKNETIISSVLNSAPIAVFVLDQDQVIKNVLGNTAEFLLYTNKEMIGQNTRFLYFTDEEYGQAGKALLGNSTTGNIPLEVRWRRKDGVEIWILLSLFPNTDLNSPAEWVIAAIDISARKRIEEQLRESQKMEAIGQLTAGIAHDFNNLLTVINGFAELIQYKMTPDDPHQESVSKVIHAGQRAADLVRQLLAFSRKQVIEPQLLNLNTVVTEMDKMLRRIIGEDVLLKTKLAPDLGWIKIDTAQMDQVIVNLAVNARDAMPQGGRLTIETANVTLDKDFKGGHLEVKPGEYILLAVSDTGCGMSAEVKTHIFEPFYTTKERGKGTGLGLATVFGITKQYGGNIWVYSEEGVGTTFKLYFPCETDPVLPATDPKAEGESLFGNQTVLVVEDDEQVRDLTLKILQEYGYTLLEAQNGQEALKLATKHRGPIHLLLTDIIMPDMNGKALANKLTETKPDLKVLYMSGYTEDIIVHHGVLDPGVNFLHKPFSATMLAQKIRKVLNQ